MKKSQNLPLSFTERNKLFYQLQAAKTSKQIQQKLAVIEGKDPATELLLSLLLGPQKAFPQFQTYFAQNPFDSELLTTILSFLSQQDEMDLNPWLKIAPETPLSEPLIRLLLKQKEKLFFSQKSSRLGLVRGKNALFWSNQLVISCLRRQHPIEIFSPSHLGAGFSLQDPAHEIYQQELDFLWIYMDAEDLVPSFKWETQKSLALLRDTLIRWIEEALKRTSAEILLSTFVAPFYQKSFYSPSLFQNVQFLNYQLFEHFKTTSRVSLLDMESLVRAVGVAQAFDPFRAVYAFAPENLSFVGEVSRWVTEWVCQTQGEIRKCVVVDLDGTLWGGSIDEGEIQVSPEYPGNAYYQFQQALAYLKESGFLLAINSKNDKEKVLEVFQKKEMPLKIEDFACIEADWSEKPIKMKRISETLGIHLNSFLFLDNDPRERFLMRQTYPEILTVELPFAAYDYQAYLGSIPQLVRFSVTTEDTKRATLYEEEKDRKKFETETQDRNKYLEALGLKVAMVSGASMEWERLSQLSKRVNQFHFSGNRFSGDKLKKISQEPQKQIWSVYAKDHFGSYGCVGMLQTKSQPTTLLVEEFFLSCRILGRGVEQALLSWIFTTSTPKQKQVLCYQETGRNHQANRFLQQLKSCTTGPNHLEILEPIEAPSWIEREDHVR